MLSIENEERKSDTLPYAVCGWKLVVNQIVVGISHPQGSSGVVRLLIGSALAEARKSRPAANLGTIS